LVAYNQNQFVWSNGAPSLCLIYGNRETVTDSRGVTAYEYGLCCSGLSSVTNPDGSWIEYEYDAQGNKTEMRTPWDTTLYTFDVLNRMKTVQSLGEVAVTEYFYNAVGNRDSLAHSNGTSVGYRYDELNRLTDVLNYDPTGNVMSSYSYELNSAGIRTAVIEHDGSRVDYVYDDLYRLTGETRTTGAPNSPPAYSIAYTYDNVGNRLTQDHDGVVTDYAYNNRDQLETETTDGETISYVYDAAGRMTEKVTPSTGLTYTWIDGDRLSSVSGSTTSLEYEYDPDGIKTATITDGVRSNVLVDKVQPYAQVIAEYDESGEVSASYMFGLERITQNRNGAVRVYLADGQGSTRRLTDQLGNVTDTYDYTAFGELLAQVGSTENSFRYVGEEFDPNAGFYYLRARWMNPVVGRFVSVDPWEGDPQAPVSLHRYLYANASPISFHDPAGEATLSNLMATMAVGGILAGVAYPILTPSEDRTWKGQVAWIATGASIGAAGYGLYYFWMYSPMILVTARDHVGNLVHYQLPQIVNRHWTSMRNAAGHFAKHGPQVGRYVKDNAYSATKYATDAHQIVSGGMQLVNKKGQTVYIRFLGYSSKGKEVFGYVVVNAHNKIVTFYPVAWDKLVKVVPGLKKGN